VVITAVIDKLTHLTQYREWSRHPYYYCLAVLLERYSLWLRGKRAVGDVMAESRGGKEDRQLKDEFRRIDIAGTDFIPHEMFVEHLTSRR
jgi:hypothetical protein